MPSLPLRALPLAAVLLTCATLPTSAASRWTADEPVVLSGRLAGLSCTLNGEDNTPQLASDPRHPSTVVATWFAGDSRAAATAVSSDGGRSWHDRRALPGLTTCSGGPAGGVVDPSLFVDSTGAVTATNGWVATDSAVTDVDHQAAREYSSSSATIGAPFPSAVDVEQAADERGYLAEVRGALFLETEVFHYAGRSFVPGGGALTVLTSNDHGQSWSRTPAQPPQVLPGHTPLAAGLLSVHGTLVALWDDIDLALAAPGLVSGGPLPGVLRASRSTDGGRTWSAATDVVACAGCVLPDAVVGGDGSLWVSFEDRAGAGRVAVARSRDAGATWTVLPVAEASGVGHGLTAVATAADGTVGVLHQHSLDGMRYDVRLSTSRDAGRTWSQTLLSAPMDLARYAGASFDGPTGAAEDLLAVPGGFLAAFTQLPPAAVEDGHEDVVTVRVRRR